MRPGSRKRESNLPEAVPKTAVEEVSNNDSGHARMVGSFEKRISVCLRKREEENFFSSSSSLFLLLYSARFGFGVEFIL